MSTDKIYQMLGMASGKRIPVSLHVSGAEFIGLVALVEPDEGKQPDTAVLFSVKYVGTKETGEIVYDPAPVYIALVAIVAFELATVIDEERAMMEVMLKSHMEEKPLPRQFVCSPKSKEPPPRAGQLTAEEIEKLTRES